GKDLAVYPSSFRHGQHMQIGYLDHFPWIRPCGPLSSFVFLPVFLSASFLFHFYYTFVAILPFVVLIIIGLSLREASEILRVCSKKKMDLILNPKIYE